MTSPRQLLTKRGLAAQKGRGQNFLSDPNTASAIVTRSGIGPGDTVLEIGPGLGALTRPILQSGARLTVVEVDQGLVEYLREELLPDYPDALTIISGDVLKTDLLGVLDLKPEEKYNVIGNLPYLISTPILLQLLAIRHKISKAVLMFQKELADRLTANPGTKDYGRLSVLMGYHSNVRRLMNLGAEVFFPRPKVGSTVVEIIFKDDPGPPLDPGANLEAVVAASFARRRKTLRNSLRSAYPADKVEQALSIADIDPGCRAETLSIEEFVALTNAFGS